MFDEKITAVNQHIDEMRQQASFDKRTYTVSEIQDILGISRTTAYNLVKTKRFKVVRIGGSIRVSKSSFDKWLDEML